jgi:hypothetical protein
MKATTFIIAGVASAASGQCTSDLKVESAQTITVDTETQSYQQQFDKIACFDLTGYTAIEFDLVAPEQTTMNITMTQNSADCQTQLVNSVYHPLSRYLPSITGKVQTVTLPISDFAKNLDGEDFDFKHLKEWTIVNMETNAAPDNVVQMSNMVLKGNCKPSQSGQSQVSSGLFISAFISAMAIVI